MSDICTCRRSINGIHDYDCALEDVRKFPGLDNTIPESQRDIVFTIVRNLRDYAWLDGLSDQQYQKIQAAVRSFARNPRERAGLTKQQEA